MSNLRQKFGERLKFLRHRAELTQEELASRAEISVDFLSLIERGINSPSFENLDKLANALNIEIVELFSFER
jgi:transcriptional regulator with XRE-family HTH domain